MKITRSLIVIFLVCIFAFNGLVTPAFADTNNSSDVIVEIFFAGIAGGIGGVVGAAGACYVVDALFFPFAPPVAVYLAGTCPVIGGAAGGVSGFAGTKALKASTNKKSYPNYASNRKSYPVHTPAYSW